jgi:hypothetical protein
VESWLYLAVQTVDGQISNGKLNHGKSHHKGNSFDETHLDFLGVLVWHNNTTLEQVWVFPCPIFPFPLGKKQRPQKQTFAGSCFFLWMEDPRQNPNLFEKVDEVLTKHRKEIDELRTKLELPVSRIEMNSACNCPTSISFLSFFSLSLSLLSLFLFLFLFPSLSRALYISSSACLFLLAT